MSLFVYLVAYIWVFYKVPVIIIYILSKLIHAAYLWVTGYDKWYLGLVPFGWFYYKKDLAGVAIWMLIVQTILELFFLTSYNLIGLILVIIMSSITNYSYANIYVDGSNPKLYACCPFYKYAYMIKEVITIARNESRG